MKLFNFSAKNVDFFVVGQPIVDNLTKKTFSFEILSRPVSLGRKFNIEGYFNSLSAADVTWVALMQLKMIKSMGRVNSMLPVNVNIHYQSLFDNDFISMVSRVSNSKLIFEINGFRFNDYLLTDLCSAFYKIKSFGHEVWLDDYSVNNATKELLLALPWDGVKIDKSLFWKLSPEELLAKVKFCRGVVDNVIIEGVEDDFLFNLSVRSSANFSQGFHWSFMKAEDVFVT
ncbi:MAG: EAL domain-containing protein [Plesiomonas shigelloides]